MKQFFNILWSFRTSWWEGRFRWGESRTRRAGKSLSQSVEMGC